MNAQAKIRVSIYRITDCALRMVTYKDANSGGVRSKWVKEGKISYYVTKDGHRVRIVTSANIEETITVESMNPGVTASGVFDALHQDLACAGCDTMTVGTGDKHTHEYCFMVESNSFQDTLDIVEMMNSSLELRQIDQ